ncbi:MAG: DNA polymerase, partial [Pseudomonadota bacterium]
MADDGGENTGVNAGHLYLIDGSGFIFRAFHALPPLTRKSDGLPVGAVSGFCNIVWKMLDGMSDDDRPTHLAVIFDKGSKSFRNEIYDGYKAQRPPPPEDLVPQFPLIRDATRAFGLPCIEVENYEADDLIATYAAQANGDGYEVTIVSSDKDLMQLVREPEDGPPITMLDPMKEKPIGVAEVIEKFGAPPEKVIDIQALAGDSVDNVPGAPGIGVKTAAQLLETFGDLETLLAQAETIKQPKRRQTLIDHAAQIRVSKQLVTLDQSAPVPEPYGDFALDGVNGATLVAFLKAMEFRTLTRRVAEALDVPADDVEAADVEVAAPARPAPAAEDAPGGKQVATEAFTPPDVTKAALPLDPAAYEVVRDAAALERWIAQIYERGAVAIDTETTSLDEMRADLVGVSLAVRPGQACYIPLGHVVGHVVGAAADDAKATAAQGDLLAAMEDADAPARSLAEGQMDREEALALLGPMLVDPSILKIGQNLKYDIKVLGRHGVETVSIDDTLLMSGALASGLRNHGMDILSDQLLGHTPIKIKELIGSGKSQIGFHEVPIEKAAPYAAEDADVALRLHTIMKPQLARDGLTTVYETLERPMAPVLATMERRGVLLDCDRLSRLSGDFAQRAAALEDEIHSLAGEPFNVGSPKQLGEILFDRMSLPGGKKNKTGAYATGADVLEELAALGHDLPARVLDWRQLSKLKSTYTDALQDHVNPETG